MKLSGRFAVLKATTGQVKAGAAPGTLPKVYVTLLDMETREQVEVSTTTKTEAELLGYGLQEIAVQADFSVFNWTPTGGGEKRTFLSVENWLIKPVAAAAAPAAAAK